MLTLGAFVNPDIPHSPTLGGESIDVTFAFSMNGSLMRFTVNPFVLLMFAAVSLRPPSGSCATEMEMSGGECETWLNKLAVGLGWEGKGRVRSTGLGLVSAARLPRRTHGRAA